jgi:two-component system, LytTR family, sensor kinase
MPRFFEKKKYVTLLIATLLLCVLYVIAAYLVEGVLENKYYNVGNTLISFKDYLFPASANFLLNATIGLAFYFASYSGRKEAESLKMENDFLKAQINPHFFINSISNVSAEMAKTNPVAANNLDALAKMMVYSMMETGPDGKVPLAREVEHINTKILFYHLRFPGTASICFDHPEIPQHLRIPPMLLITLVENALKHGEFNKKDKPLDIMLHLNGNNLVFTVNNWIRQGPPDLTFSVGLPNLKKRLERFYKKKFHFETKQFEDTYFAELIIPL